MKYAEIIKLIEAGYSRDEIIAMQESPQDDQQDAQQDPAQGDQHDSAQGDQQDPALGDFSGMMEEMKNIFTDFKNELQAINIMNSQQRQDIEETSEDIIANIINPFNHDKKK